MTAHIRLPAAIFVLFAASACAEKRPLPLTPENDAGMVMMMPPDAGRRDSGADVFDPLCESCRRDGESCEVSFNCEAGSICNSPDEEFYDSTRPEKTCIRVICSDSVDCLPPKVCTAKKICELPTCQADSDCASPQGVCEGGECVEVRAPSAAAGCIILTRSQRILSEQSLPLEALVLDAAGRPIRGLVLEWSSSDPAAVGIVGQVAIGGSRPGEAEISAAVSGNNNVSCIGLVLTNVDVAPAQFARVTVLSDQTLTPVVGAEVTVFLPAPTSLTTNMQGHALFTPGFDPPSITVHVPGYHAVSVLRVVTRDILILLSPEPDPSVAGGVRGVVDISADRRADIPMAVGGTARNMNLLDHGVVPGERDILPTTLNVPELGLNNAEIDLPGNYLLGLGSRRFTEDELRCQGVTPSAQELGCYLLRAPAGPTTPYVFAGQLRLSQITAIANELSSFLEEQTNEETTYRALLTFMSPIIPELRHGALPRLTIQEFPRTAPGDVDFSRYQHADMRASYELGIHGVVAVPSLSIGSQPCVSATMLTVYSIAHGRGLVPLGVRVARDAEPSDCLVDGTDKPFGDSSADVPAGEVPISIAPRHSGLEGGRLLMAISAIELEVDRSNERLQSTIYQRYDALSPRSAAVGEFLEFPRGTLLRQAARVELQSDRNTPVTGVRFTIESGAQKWFIYAPDMPASFELPDIAPLRQLANSSDRALVQAFVVDGNYDELFTFGAEKSMLNFVENVSAIAGRDATVTD
jgi:hypothetical protein